jgi:putative N6-adenine-specific DNA methylase
MLAKCLAGTEDVLFGELRELGATNILKVKRGVQFKGDLGFLYKSNLWLRTALRILMPVAEFKARNEEEIYRKVKQIAWEDHFGVEKTIVVKASVFAPHIKNSLFLSQRVKDAIADRFRECIGRRPSVSKENPDIVIDIYVAREKVVVSLDSSGESLHKRGYREETGRAPLSEVLAAAILKLAGWDGLKHFVDPMCGSGTFLIEASLMAHNIPPGVFRQNFAFKNWKLFDEELYKLIFDKALEKEKNFHFSITGFDRDSRAILKARHNLKKSLMIEQVTTEKLDFLNIPEGREFPTPGLLVVNPPYGEKLEADIPALYQGIGDSLKRHFPGYQAWLLTANEEGLKHVGLKASQKIPLKNGNLDCWLVKYELYEGSRKHGDGIS